MLIEHTSVGLSRSALEEALGKKIPPLLQRKAREEWPNLGWFETLIKTARTSILEKAPEICDLADKVRRRANAIVHGKACKESDALDLLRDTRRIIHFLYG
jgi:hypothetical protein